MNKNDKPRARRCRTLDKFLEDPTQRVNRADAHRLRCLDCCGNQPGEVRLCTAYTCPAWGYRMGGAWECPPLRNRVPVHDFSLREVV